MTTQIQRRRGTTAQHSTFTGAVGEVTVDTDKEVLVVHDGAQVGGYPQMRENGSNSALALGSAGTPSLKFTGDTNTGIYSPGADQVAISTGGSGRLFVDASGNVGLGSSNPTSRLQSAGTVHITSGGTPASGAGLEIGYGNAASSTSSLISYDRTGASWLNTDYRSLNHIFFTNGTERLRITSAGLVGVGTSSPADKLHIEGAGQQGLRIRNTTNGSNASPQSSVISFRGFYNSADLARIEVQDRSDSNFGGWINIATQNSSQVLTNAVHIDSSQRVGIGTSSPAQLLHLSQSGTGDFTSIRFANTGASGRSYDFGLGGNTTGLPGAFYLYDNNAAATRLLINSSGNVGIGTTSPSTSLTVASTASQVATFTSNVNGGAFLRTTSPLNDAAFGVDGTGGFFTVVNSAPLLFKTADTERLRIDSSGRVGIGTSSPANALNIVGSSATTNTGATVSIDDNAALAAEVGGTIALRGTDGTATRNYALIKGGKVSSVSGVFDGFLAFHTRTNGQANTTERLRINEFGNVGIGTTSPGTLLHLSASIPILRIQDTDGSDQLSEIEHAGPNLLIGARDGASSGNIVFRGLAGGSGTERARIDSSGRLLVGTSSTVNNGQGDARLQVASNNYYTADFGQFSNDAFGGAVYFKKTRSTTAGGFAIVADGDYLGDIRFAGTDGANYIRAASIECRVDGTPGTNDMPGRLVFSTTADGASSPTERMRIQNNGFLKVSNNGAYAFGGLSIHEIRSTANSRTLQLNNASTAYTDYHLAMLVDTAAGTGWQLIRGENSGGACFVVFGNGNVQNTNNSYGAISDIKLKENIVDANSQWDDIKALRPVNYNFKEGQTHTQIGLIAQEVELVSPGLVTEFPDRDEDGNDLGTVTKSVNYSVLYMKAVKALQEAMERIETLEAKVAALESA